MNKTKMTLAVTGGVIGLAVLVMAYFTWTAFSAKTAALEGDDEEGTEGLETVSAKAQSLSHKAVYPCAASLSAIQANQKAVDEWCKEGLALATRGDKVFEKTSTAAFKTFIVADAKRIMALPGAVGGVLVKPDFAFGPFKPYISEGKMPTDAELTELQRRWDDVATVVEILAQSGIAELTDVQFAAVKPTEEAQADDRKGRKNAGKGKKKGAGKAVQSHVPSSFSYVFTFTTRPVAFIKALNALEASERYVTVDGFTFSRPSDPIAEALGGDEKKKSESQAGSRRSRRSRRAAAEEEKKDEEKENNSGIITDPLLDAPFTVVMNVSVHDFRSLEEKKDEEVKK